MKSKFPECMSVSYMQSVAVTVVVLDSCCREQWHDGNVSSLRRLHVTFHASFPEQKAKTMNIQTVQNSSGVTSLFLQLKRVVTTVGVRVCFSSVQHRTKLIHHNTKQQHFLMPLVFCLISCHIKVPWKQQESIQNTEQCIQGTKCTSSIQRNQLRVPLLSYTKKKEMSFCGSLLPVTRGLCGHWPLANQRDMQFWMTAQKGLDLLMSTFELRPQTWNFVAFFIKLLVVIRELSFNSWHNDTPWFQWVCFQIPHNSSKTLQNLFFYLHNTKRPVKFQIPGSSKEIPAKYLFEVGGDHCTWMHLVSLLQMMYLMRKIKYQGQKHTGSSDSQIITTEQKSYQIA